MPTKHLVIWLASVELIHLFVVPSGIGILPQDTISILEDERGSAIDVPKSEKMDWSVVRDKIAKHGMRNSNVIAIAPTATISNIMGSSPCIEPTYKNLFVKSNLSGDFMVLNRYLVKPEGT